MNLELHAISESMSIITHNSGTAGNESLINLERIVTPNGARWVPFLSGNAIRNRAVREPGMRWLIELYELDGKLTKSQLAFLLNGGSLTESGGTENLGLIHRLRRTWPLIRLLGGSLPSQLLHGSLNVWRGTLVCEENRPHLRDVPEARLLSAESFLTNYQYTRTDSISQGTYRPIDVLAEADEVDAMPRLSGFDDKKDKSDRHPIQMIFNGQAVQRGSLWEHGFVIRNASQLRLGALLWSLCLWQRSGGTIGGAAARGHGRLRMYLIIESEEERERCHEAVREYVAYAASVKDEAVASLMEAFA